ncbi:MAG: uridine diphosphate-N-acetylglucosamine-binding protein YvcK, partial [Acidimicrobiia bacterium]
MSTYEPQTQLSPLELSPGGPAVVAIGGGHGLAQALEAVLAYASSVTGIVTVADDGGSSGRLTSTLDIPPPGDVRKALLALSPEPSVFGELFAYRFEDTDVAGHSLGNLILASLTDLLGDFTTAIRTAEVMLGALGRVIPAAPTSLHLQATIDGTIVEGQATINSTRGRIEEMKLIPEDTKATREALDAITEADQIVIGPGSLYTSLITALMVPGIPEAVEAARGRLIWVMNL